MIARRFQAAFLLSILIVAGCGPKPVEAPPPPPPPPPAPKQSLVVLLPQDDGKPSAITITNSAGSQTLSQSYEAVRIQRADTAPSSPSVISEAEVRRIFGQVLDISPRRNWSLCSISARAAKRWFPNLRRGFRRF